MLPPPPRPAQLVELNANSLMQSLPTSGRQIASCLRTKRGPKAGCTVQCHYAIQWTRRHNRTKSWGPEPIRGFQFPAMPVAIISITIFWRFGDSSKSRCTTPFLQRAVRPGRVVFRHKELELNEPTTVLGLWNPMGKCTQLRSGKGLECRLLEPRNMVHPGPNSRSSPSSLQNLIGEHLAIRSAKI